MRELTDDIKAKFSDQVWRLDHLYYITDTRGRKIRFRMNAAQRDMVQNLHEFNVILKARQLGFSTLILIYALDMCLFNCNLRAGVIAQGLNEAEDLFANKVKFAYDSLPRWLKSRITADSDTARRLVFSNGSSIQVGTSLRGGTFQVLHISEYGKIAARYPDKAIEIKTGAFNTVHPGQRIFVESTAEGQYGEFYELVMRAARLRDEGVKLTSLDPKLFFYGWNWRDTYRIDGDVMIGDKMRSYFDQPGIKALKLDAKQKAWYVKKSDEQGDYMKREFPSIWTEAFEQSMEGAYFTEQMTRLRREGQIRDLPWESARFVDTWWDLGMNDSTTIWFFQHIGNQMRFIDYYECSDVGIEHYAMLLRQKGYYYGTHYWPHDGNVRDLSTGKRRLETARSFGVWPIKILPKTKSKIDSIQALRTMLPRLWFDATKCEHGIRHVDNYRKTWNDRLGVWNDSPLHNAASHGVDPLLSFAENYGAYRDEFVDEERVMVSAEDFDPLEVW